MVPDSQPVRRYDSMVVLVETDPDRENAASNLDVPAMADPNCKLCLGKGEVPRIREDGYLAPEVCYCIQQRKLRRVAKNMIKRRFPGPLAKKTFKEYDDGGNARNKLASDSMKRFVDKFDLALKEGWIVGLMGKPSSGKTHLAIATAIYAIDRWRADAMMINATKLMKISEGDSEDLMEKATSAELLILDDLGMHHEARVRSDKYDTNWQDQRLYELLDERISRGLPTIYTTNLERSAFEEKLSERVRARIDRAEVASFQLDPVPQKNTPNKSRRNLLLGLEDNNEDDGGGTA